MKERQYITIKIAGQAFRLEDPGKPEELERLRRAERSFNKLWSEWCNGFNNQSPQVVMAMVAFQYTRHYYNLLDTMNASEKAISEFEQKLDEILLSIK